MSEQDTTSTETPDPTTEPERPSAPPAAKPATNAGQEPDVPDWAKEKVSKANREAANYRTQLREAQTALGEKDQALGAERARALRAEVALVYRLDPELAGLLTGTTEDEIRAKADTLAKHVKPEPKPPVDFLPGKRGSAPSAKTDPDAWLRNLARRA